ncbi:mast cell protease 1A-like [Astyanax mexicanus]|nr:mast cell protease 1A-like [Astyanax mexicanus]
MVLFSLLLLAALLQYPGHSASVKVGIINGTEVKPHSRPYMAFVHGQIICGGFLVSEQYVMTAAHCWENKSTLTVRLGAHDLLDTNDGSVSMAVETYIQQPQYTDGQLDYDIMLLKLRGTVKKSQTVNWISIPQRDEDIPANLKCSVAGWGKTGDTKNPSYRLMETDVHIIDGAKCKESWGRYPNPRMMCALYPGGFCQGDSGGPLVCKNTAVGIVSFNQKNNCDSPNVPNVYAKISAFLPWIKSVIGNV